MKEKYRSFLGWVAVILLLSGGLSACQLSLPLRVEAAQPTATPAPVVASAAVSAEGHIVPRDFTRLAFTIPGDIEDVLVKEGDVVHAGDVLARLVKGEAYAAAVTAAQLEQTAAQQAITELRRKASLAGGQANQALHTAELALIAAQQQLADLDTDDYQQKIDDAWLDVNNAKDELDTAQEDFDKVKNLAPDNTAYKNADQKLKDAQKKYDDMLRAHDRLVNALDQARAAVDLAQANKDDAQRIYDARRNGPDPDQLALAQSRVDNAGVQLKAAQAAMDDLELKAPFDATVTEVNVASGEHAMPSINAFTLADLTDLYVDTSDLTEMDVVKIEEGQKVTVTPDSLPDLNLRGVVESIARGYSEKGGDIVYKVRIHLTDTDPRLRWGMTVNAVFDK